MPVPVISVAQMRAWEQASWAAGRSPEAVIARAGAQVARLARQMTCPATRILVLAGKGHNGDDARQAVPHLGARPVEISPQCLKCHTTGQGYVPESFAESFHFREGVDCEACHGPGGRYAGAEVMRDAPAARHAGLAVISQETCRPCHETAHGKPFNYAEALAKIRHPKPKPAAAAAAPGYKTPLNMALSPDGRELWVVCE